MINDYMQSGSGPALWQISMMSSGAINKAVMLFLSRTIPNVQSFTCPDTFSQFKNLQFHQIGKFLYQSMIEYIVIKVLQHLWKYPHFSAKNTNPEIFCKLRRVAYIFVEPNNI